jgi:hypothetical protein
MAITEIASRSAEASSSCGSAAKVLGIVYFGIDGSTMVLLLGGDKSTQTADIRKAKSYWSDYHA